MNLTTLAPVALLGAELISPAITADLSSETFKLPPAAAEVFIRSGGDRETSLLEAITETAEASGVQVHTDASVAGRLCELPAGFDRDFTIPAEDAWAVTEHALMQSGFVLSVLRHGGTHVVAVKSARSELNQVDAVFQAVTVEDLEYVREHPAILFELPLELSNIDVRTTSRELRMLINADGSFQCVPLGVNDIILKGVGHRVGAVAELLLSVNERAGARWQTQNEETEASSDG